MVRLSEIQFTGSSSNNATCRFWTGETTERTCFRRNRLTSRCAGSMDSVLCEQRDALDDAAPRQIPRTCVRWTVKHARKSETYSSPHPARTPTSHSRALRSSQCQLVPARYVTAKSTSVNRPVMVWIVDRAWIRV